MVFEGSLKRNPYYNECYYVGFNIRGELWTPTRRRPKFHKVRKVQVSYWGVENNSRNSLDLTN
jgi:hypothetical protein